MKLFITSIAIIFVGFALITGFTKTPKTFATSTFQPVAVVELFTSQGCSSCPPADKLLAHTIANANIENKHILALSFHVDYWNRLGWKDPFSNNIFSQRQNAYVNKFKLESAYTPQIIVNGKDEFVGSDENKLNQSVSNALNTNALVNFKSLSATYNIDKTISVNFSLEGDYKNSTINVALISLSETTAVNRGENAGHTLSSKNIVRQFLNIPATQTGAVEIENPAKLAKENIAIVAFVQQEKTLNIVGGAIAKF